MTAIGYGCGMPIARLGGIGSLVVERELNKSGLNQ